MTKIGRRPKEYAKYLQPLYGTWQAMVGRCHSATNAQYKHYGARGISVYGPWRESFEDYEFYVAQLPYFEEEGRTIDRINNDGNYEPGNVRWATETEQKRNMRTNRFITHNGKTQCLKAWANEIGMTSEGLGGRLKAGWSIERALDTPVYRPGMIECNGKSQRLHEWAKESGISECTILFRLGKGWPVERALYKPIRSKRDKDSAPAGKSAAKEEPLYPFNNHEVTP